MLYFEVIIDRVYYQVVSNSIVVFRLIAVDVVLEHAEVVGERIAAHVRHWTQVSRSRESWEGGNHIFVWDKAAFRRRRVLRASSNRSRTNWQVVSLRQIAPRSLIYFVF